MLEDQGNLKLNIETIDGSIMRLNDQREDKNAAILWALDSRGHSEKETIMMSVKKKYKKC